MRLNSELLSIFLLIVLSPFSILGAEGITTNHQQNLIDITIAEYGEYPLYTALYVADAKGFFKDEGLRVKIVPAGGDEKVFAALLSGNAQFGVGDPLFTAISGERGRPGIVIASILQGVPAWGVAIDKKVPIIKHPSQLSNLSVATYPAPSTSYTLQHKMFVTGGIKTNIIPIAYGGLIAALQARRVDIALENEPNVSLAEIQGARRVYSLGQYYPEFAFTGLTVLPEYLEKNEGIAQKVVNSFQRANKFIHEHTSDTIDVLAERFPELPREVLETAITNVIKANIFTRDSILTRNAWDAAAMLRKEVGDLKNEPRYQDYVVTKYAEKTLSIR